MADPKYAEIVRDLQAKVQRNLKALDQEIVQELDRLKAGPELAPSGPNGAELWQLFEKFAHAYTQVDLLNLLVESASEFMPRVMLLIRKGGTFHGWAGRGFSGEFLAGGLKRVKWGIDTYPELARINQERASITTNFSDLSELSDEITGFDGFVPLKSCFFPLVVKNKVAALLYADSGSETRLEGKEMAALLCYVAGLELTMVTAKIKVRPEGASKSAEAKPAAVHEEPPAAAPAEAMPMPSAKPRPTQPKPVETPSEATIPPGDEDPAVKKAKRVARVLVSDLKLYNEQAVADARRNGDLYSRLKEDLDRSYKHYQERVAGLLKSPQVNYFKEELIRQLADGNADLLGPMPF